MAAKRSKSKAKSSARRPAPSAHKPAAKALRKKARKKAKTAVPRTEPAASSAESQVEQIQRVIDVMVAAGAVEVELEAKGAKLRIRLKEDRPGLAVPMAGGVAPMAVAMEAPTAGVDAASSGAPAPEVAAGEVFKSPMVGTFYRSPSPDSDVFVKEGDLVNADSVLCIIEAMKVMNEIKAEMEGQVVEVLAQNGEPVDYGQPLFVIKA